MSRDIMSRPPVPAAERVSYGTGPSQFFDLFRPPASPPVALAIMIHGGFWRSRYDLTHASHLCAALAHANFLVASLEYRRVGNGGGWPATYDDIRAGFQAVLKKAAPLPPPVVLGHSAGGHLALRLAVDTDQMAGVVGLAPVACLDLAYHENLGSGAVAEFLGDISKNAAAYESADPSHHPSRVPRVLLYGDRDDVVPPSIGRAFASARASDPGSVKFIELPGVDHSDLIDPQSFAWSAVLAAARAFDHRH